MVFWNIKYQVPRIIRIVQPLIAVNFNIYPLYLYSALTFTKCFPYIISLSGEGFTMSAFHTRKLRVTG
jgi:hypothetical protein